MWTHWMKRLDDRCPGLFNPWLTAGILIWPRSAGGSSSSVVPRGPGWCRCLLLGEAGVGLYVLLPGGAGTAAVCS